MTTSVVHVAANERPAGVRRGTRSRFYLGVSAALLAIVLAAFAPTFYLRAQFGAPPLPLYLWVHGAVLTAWFVCLVVQSSLMAGGRAIVHRRLGIVGAGLGAAVVATGVTTTWRFVPRLTGAGVDIDAALPQLSAIVWGDLGLLAAFAVLFSAAIVVRRRPQAHKRLVLLASINLVPPALARVAQWPVFGFGGVDQVLFALGGLLLLVVVLVAHDVTSIRRVHAATLFGVSVVLLLAVSALAVGGSEFARAVVRSL
jgi:hypothetical protein